MKITNWKKDKRYKNHFVNTDTKENIAIVFDFPGFENKWLVSIMDRYDDEISTKTFKTKLKALAYAKAYMRKK